MPESEGLNVQPEMKNFEKLPNQELGNLIAAVGNHEAKAIVLGLMKPGVIYTSGDLYSVLKEAQGSNPGWNMSRGGPFQYCQLSFSPIGLVAKEVTTAGGLDTVGYIKTEKGVTLGESLAGHLLTFSLRYPQFALNDFFAAANSVSTSEVGDKKRAPLTRVKILWEIATSHLPIRETDLASAVGEELPAVYNHLEMLQRKNIIGYDSMKLGEIFSFFTLSTGKTLKEPTQFKGDISLTKAVYKLIEQADTKKQWTAQEVGQILAGNEAGINRRRSDISNVLSHLARQGYLEQGRYHGPKHSEINLSEEQREIILDLLNIIDEFQAQDPNFLTEGRKILSQILVTPEKVAALMQKAKEHSSNANQRSREETNQELLGLIKVHPGITAEILKSMLSQPLSRSALSKYLRDMGKEGQIKVEKIKGVPHFF